MFIDAYYKPIDNKAIHSYITKTGITKISIRWHLIPKKKLGYADLNEKLDELEEIAPAATPDRGRTITEIDKLFKNKWFYRYENAKTHSIEICGYEERGEDIVLFRYGNSSHNLHTAEYTGREAVEIFENKMGTKFESIFGTLSLSYFKYRDCCPAAVDYADEDWIGMIVEGVNKADISSAYGYELTKLLPVAYTMIEKPGIVEPSEEYPFAFYLNSNNMAIYGEGSTFDWKDNAYARMARKNCKYDVPNEKEKTLLMKGIKHSAVSRVVNELYNGRKEHPENKAFINYSVGFLSPSKVVWKKDENGKKTDELAMKIMWHVRAAIVFRCNQRILNYCNELLEKGSLPILINTDSISWIGREMPADLATEKKLGAFLLEHEDMWMNIGGIKSYQYKDGDEITTVYSGMKKAQSATLGFGYFTGDNVVSLLTGFIDKTFCYDPKLRRYCYLSDGRIVSKEEDEYV